MPAPQSNVSDADGLTRIQRWEKAGGSLTLSYRARKKRPGLYPHMKAIGTEGVSFQALTYLFLLVVLVGWYLNEAAKSMSGLFGSKATAIYLPTPDLDVVSLVSSTPESVVLEGGVFASVTPLPSQTTIFQVVFSTPTQHSVLQPTQPSVIFSGGGVSQSSEFPRSSIFVPLPGSGGGSSIPVVTYPTFVWPTMIIPTYILPTQTVVIHEVTRVVVVTSTLMPSPVATDVGLTETLTPVLASETPVPTLPVPSETPTALPTDTPTEISSAAPTEAVIAPTETLTPTQTPVDMFSVATDEIH